MKRSIVLTIFLVSVILLLAMPAYAGITVECNQVDDTNVIEVTYTMDGGDANLPRAFGLDFSIDAGTIGKVYDLDPNFYVAPGTFEPCSPDPNWGNPVVDKTATSFTLEMGSLYEGANEPPSSGTLCRFTVSSSCTVSIAEDASRTGADSNGVVMENTEKSFDASYVTLIGWDAEIGFPCYHECGATGDQECADYQVWLDFNMPVCWCYPRHCHGDADNQKTGFPWTGYFYVSQPDLDVMSVGWFVAEPPQGSGINGLTDPGTGLPAICGDFGHDQTGFPWTGYFRVSQPDLDKLSDYWFVKEPPDGSGTPINCNLIDPNRYPR